MLTPEKMTVIYTVQGLQNKVTDIIPFTFEELESMTIAELRHLQDELIPRYNKAITDNNARLTWMKENTLENILTDAYNKVA